MTEQLIAVSEMPVIDWSGSPRQVRPAHVRLIGTEGTVVWEHRPRAADLEARVGLRLEPFSTYTVELDCAEAVYFRTIETGPLERADWKAQWWAAPAGSSAKSDFDAPTGVERARLYIAAQGLVRVAINGVALNADRLDPSRSAPSRALYRAFDVSAVLQAGSNEVEVVLGLGSWGATGLDPRVLVEVDYWVDGVRRAVPVQPTRIATSPVTRQVPFYIERVEEIPTRPLDAEVYEPAEIPLIVSPDISPLLKVVDTRPTREILRTGRTRVYDVGDNIAGRTRITLQASIPPGTVISVIHGEHLDAEGRVDTTNLTMPYDNGRRRQVFEWAPAGEAGASGEAWFSYFGFRYVQVDGVPEAVDIAVEARVLHSDVSSALEATSSDPAVSALFSAAQRTALNNLHSVPEDCPTREQAAWTGDVASAAEWQFSAFDMRSFFEKWLVDLADSQNAEGAIAGIAPDPRGATTGADAVWGSAMPRVAINHWLHYGDDHVIQGILPHLRAWCTFVLSKVGESGIVDQFPISYGHDWLALDQTPPALLHTAAGIDALVVLATLEAAVEDGTPKRWTQHAHELRQAARDLFVAEDGRVANGSQGAYAAAIAAGIVWGSEAEFAIERIAADVIGRGNRVSTGFAATRWLVEALSDHGKNDLLGSIIRQPEQPGIGAMITQGPGTFWENWWIDPQNTGTGSLDHIGLGAPFAAWLLRAVAGLSPGGRGWSTTRFAPHPLVGTPHVHVSLQTARGLISGGWSRTDDGVDYSLDVPDGVEVLVRLPGRAEFAVGGGGHLWSGFDPEHDGTAVIDDAPASTPTWHAPSIATRAGDIDRDPISRAALVAGRGTPSLEVVQQLECMPIPHPQFGDPVTLVRARDSGSTPTVILPIAPEDSRSSVFAYAHLDLCIDLPPGEIEMLLRLHLVDGTVSEQTARIWPAGWNRVVVPVDERQRGCVTAIEVGIVSTGNDVDDDLAVYKADGDLGFGFHLGEIGFSGSRALW